MQKLRDEPKVIAITTILVAAFTLAGCSSLQDSTSQQLVAINEIRESFELPALPLVFIEMTTDVNSPNGLEVAIYQDSEGRKYSVDPETNQVVEIDARTILGNISPDTPTLLPDELRAQAIQYLTASVPNFNSLQSSWQYEESTKTANYFFNWYGEQKPGSANRPRIQICLHQSGLLFCYYNTMTLEQ